jgi:hypothetical protein
VGFFYGVNIPFLVAASSPKHAFLDPSGTGKTTDIQQPALAE